MWLKPASLRTLGRTNGVFSQQLRLQPLNKYLGATGPLGAVTKTTTLPATEEVGRTLGAQVLKLTFSRKPVGSGAGWELQSRGKPRPQMGKRDLHSPNHHHRPGTNVHQCFLARRETNSSREEAEIRVGSASVSCLRLFPSEFCSGRDSALVGIPRRETRCSSPRRS